MPQLLKELAIKWYVIHRSNQRAPTLHFFQQDKNTLNTKSNLNSNAIDGDIRNAFNWKPDFDDPCLREKKSKWYSMVRFIKHNEKNIILFMDVLLSFLRNVIYYWIEWKK